MNENNSKFKLSKKQTTPDWFLMSKKQAEPWIARLLVVSCLSLAAKIKNTDLSLLDLQVNMTNCKCVCKNQTVSQF